MFECDTSSIFHRIQYIYNGNHSIQSWYNTINVLVNSLVLVCKWSIYSTFMYNCVLFCGESVTQIMLLKYDVIMYDVNNTLYGMMS